MGNRQLKRKLKRLEEKQKTHTRNSMNIDYENDPCAYIGGKPAYVGDVIKLKNYNEISDGTYKMTLEKLIMQNHRFVIIHHFGIKKRTLAVCLLSTSEYLNKKQELGIKLYGEYSDYADVYMDATRCWIIPSSCAKSIEYKLDYDDKVRCSFNWVDNYSGEMKVLPGLTYNSLVDSQLADYEKWFERTRPRLAKNYIKCNNVVRYIKGLTDNEIKEYLLSQPEDLVQWALNLEYEERKRNGNPLPIKTQNMPTAVPTIVVEPDRDMLVLAMARILIENNDFERISKKQARGY